MSEADRVVEDGHHKAKNNTRRARSRSLSRKQSLRRLHKFQQNSGGGDYSGEPSDDDRRERRYSAPPAHSDQIEYDTNVSSTFH